MASNEATALDEQAQMVEMVTGFENRAVIVNALRENHGNVDTVVNEYLDDPAKFGRKYGWDETAFSAGRDGDESAANNPNVPSFTINSPPVLYGTDPSFYGGPSRPPSRANNRSPLSRLVESAAGGQYTTATPSNRQEEEDQLQQAINLSLNTSGVQSPHPFPPPPLPVPQQSGVMNSNGESSAYFGPANRPDYDQDQWAMVPLGRQDSDSDPSLRARKSGAPVFLRCRINSEWEKHRVGGLMMVFHKIPAVRNLILRIGITPDYGYGNKGDWWQGEPIGVPLQPESDGWAGKIVPSWTDEIHRLVAFLELSERAYGTADILIRARTPTIRDSWDAEKDLFENFTEASLEGPAVPKIETLVSSVSILMLDTLDEQGNDRFALLDLHIPETFYIDRYLQENGLKLQKIQFEMVTLLNAYEVNVAKERQLAQTNLGDDRRAVMGAAIRRRLERASKFKHDTYWRTQGQTPIEVEGDYYLPDHVGELALLPEEAEIADMCEAEIRELEGKLVEMDRIMNDAVLPERRAIDEVNLAMAALLTAPSADEEWNPKHKYSLRGVIPDPDTVYLRMRAPIDEAEVAPTNDAPADGAPACGASGDGEEGWWRTTFKPEDNTVEHTAVTYEAVLREACGTGCKPIVVYANDKAMQEEDLPISDALKTFIRLDNRHFKQEVSQAGRLGHKRSAGAENGSQSKRLQRSSSIGSMDTNHASAGDLEDDDMRDAPFDTDAVFGATGAPQDDAIPDLVDIPPLSGTLNAPPSYDNYAEVEAASVSPAFAQVSLGDANGISNAGSSNNAGSSPLPKGGQEMQERPNSQLFGQLGNNNTSTGVDEDEPLIDLSEPIDVDPKVPAGGV
ncbi:uncharacterized protein C8A04DRAFT_38394 [Dichotomopilus funicola]|uniref:Ubiquitin interaction domain-containing protein n=1 Tax=Dichotomopilus funicola TaxID=1934379 RepID=A0AAN6V021_9PEZI|nr:hypothetical protein C8A04DRAFT_38394 [Dichotomopilus funicola]